MPEIPMPMTATQASAATGIPKRTILHAIKTGKLPAQMVSGYMYLIDPADVDTWVAGRDAKASA